MDTEGRGPFELAHVKPPSSQVEGAYLGMQLEIKENCMMAAQGIQAGSTDQEDDARLQCHRRRTTKFNATPTYLIAVYFASGVRLESC